MDHSTQPAFFSHFKTVTADYWLMLLLLFVMKAGQFMLLPFLALYLSAVTHAPTSQIGIALGLGPICYGLVGPFSGYVIDRFGPRYVVAGSVFVAGIVFIIFNAEKTIGYYTLMNILVGISRSFFDVASRSYRAHEMSAQQRRFCISLRFSVLNSAAAIGPIIGLGFIQRGSLALFVSIGVVYLFFAFWVWFLLKGKGRFFKIEPPNMLQVFKWMLLDWRLLCLVLGSLLMMACYSQLDSIWPLYLKAHLTHGVQVFTWAIIINAVGCMCLQLPISKLTQTMAERKLIVGSSAVYCLAYAILALSLNIPLLLFSAVLIVIAENILSPLTDLLIYHIAPKALLASYYGAMIFSMMGIGIGPLLGGFVYQYASAKILFLACIGTFVIMASLFYLVAGQHRKF